MPSSVSICVEQLLQQRSAAAEATRALKREILKLSRSEAYAALVEEISGQVGVGRFSAIRMLLEVGDITRFHSADSFAHFLGLTPSEYTSGEVCHRGHIRKCGPAFLRGWLLQCAWASVRGKNADPRLLACYQRVLVRAGKKRAIVAVARRLALRVRARWLEALEKAQSQAAA